MWDDVHEAVDRLLLADAIGECMHTIRDKERTVIYLKYWEEMNFKEIGKYLKISPARIGQIHHRALRRLRGDKAINILAKCAIPEAEKEQKRRFDEWVREERERKLAKVLKKPERVIHLPDGRCTRRPIEFPVLEDKIVEIVRDSQIPPLEISLVHTPDGIPYLYIPSWMGNIVRAHDPKKYDQWMEWFQKNGNHITKGRRSIWH